MSKYLFLIPTLFTGGAERAVSVLSGALSNLGQEVCILKYYNLNDEYHVDEKVKIISFKKDETEYRKSSYLSKLRFIRKTIKEEKPDFIIPYMFEVARAVDLATKFMKVNVFQTIRNNPTVFPKSKIQRKFRDRLIYKSRCVFVQNTAQKSYFKKKAHDKIHVVFNPVNEDFFKVEKNKKNNEFVFCATGRLVKVKNFELLIRSFNKAFNNKDNVKLVIYGEGSLRAELQGLIDKMGLTFKIVLFGRTNDMISAYEDADAFVLSSDFEGMPNALIEAMASGVPSISTDCPTGPSDIIDNGINGLLVPINDESALSNAMKKIYDDVNLREKFSLLGRKKIKEICSSEKIAKNMIEICEAYKH